MAQAAADHNEYVAQLLIAEFYSDGRGGFPHDLVESDKWLIIAIRQFMPNAEMAFVRQQLEHVMSKDQVPDHSTFVHWSETQRVGILMMSNSNAGGGGCA